MYESAAAEQPAEGADADPEEGADDAIDAEFEVNKD